jgi:hypothetical protein
MLQIQQNYYQNDRNLRHCHPATAIATAPLPHARFCHIPGLCIRRKAVGAAVQKLGGDFLKDFNRKNGEKRRKFDKKRRKIDSKRQKFDNNGPKIDWKWRKID